MGKLIHDADGAVSNGKENILDIQPAAISQVTPVYIGGKVEINLIEKFMREG
jgi:fructose-1,6-bisphosphatase I